MAFFRKKKEIPVGLWMKCPACGKMAFTKTVEEKQNCCPECDHHMKVNGPTRAKQLLDEGSFEPIGEELEPKDILRFKDEHSYEDKLKKTAAKAGVSEACTAGRGTIGGIPVTLAALDFTFRGGSMGVVVGERIALAADDAYERKAPLIVVATSGGARMQEGALSLMQMAKTSATIARLREEGIPYIVILADPCTGGVSASFAAQGDVTLAEPGALIGFAGPRVIQNTIKTSLPEGFQRAEFLLEKGYVDRIVNRRDLKQELQTLLEYLAPNQASEPPTAETAEAAS
ncbi:MAG: acetyl-CoA carboxylase, carboxyltransferase subunit beta [Planctomycetota bacterium]|nr:acetyl-CoA carboxylase, carboxyltransferase subunit beta [Planctomycetota bacterium]